MDEVIRVKLIQEPRLEYNAITSPKKAIEMIKDLIGDLDRENFILVNLDNAGKPINYQIASIGDEKSSVVSMPSLFRTILLSGATNIMVFHNHPSGNLTPSFADKKITNQLQQACKIMGINLLDHCIVSNNDYFSFMENQLLDKSIIDGYSVKDLNLVFEEINDNSLNYRKEENNMNNKTNSAFDKYMALSEDDKRNIYLYASFYNVEDAFNNNKNFQYTPKDIENIGYLAYQTWLDSNYDELSIEDCAFKLSLAIANNNITYDKAKSLNENDLAERLIDDNWYFSNENVKEKGR